MKTRVASGKGMLLKQDPKREPTSTVGMKRRNHKDATLTGKGGGALGGEGGDCQGRLRKSTDRVTLGRG